MKLFFGKIILAFAFLVFCFFAPFGSVFAMSNEEKISKFENTYMTLVEMRKKHYVSNDYVRDILKNISIRLLIIEQYMKDGRLFSIGEKRTMESYRPSEINDVIYDQISGSLNAVDFPQTGLELREVFRRNLKNKLLVANFGLNDAKDRIYGFCVDVSTGECSFEYIPVGCKISGTFGRSMAQNG